MRAMNRKHVGREAVTKLGAALIALFGICSLFAPGVARAGATEDERGFFLGLKFVGASLHADESSSEFFVKDDGGGLQLDIGYRFNPVFMLELVVGGSTHETSDPRIEARTASIQIFAHHRFLADRPFRPYLKGGFGGYALRLESGAIAAQLNGGGIAIGGGFRFFFSPHFSLGVDLTHNMIRYEEAQLSLGEFGYQTSIDEYGSLTTLGVMFGYSF
jgi:hypothetical protein